MKRRDFIAVLRRRGSSVAASGAGEAVRDAGGWVPRQQVAWWVDGPCVRQFRQGVKEVG
jgi:hypothetical protein